MIRVLILVPLRKSQQAHWYFDVFCIGNSNVVEFETGVLGPGSFNPSNVFLYFKDHGFTSGGRELSSCWKLFAMFHLINQFMLDHFRT